VLLQFGKIKQPAEFSAIGFERLIAAILQLTV